MLNKCRLDHIVTYLIRQSLSQPCLMEPVNFASSICRALAQKYSNVCLTRVIGAPSTQLSSFTQLKPRKLSACPPSRNQLTFTFFQVAFWIWQVRPFFIALPNLLKKRIVLWWFYFGIRFPFQRHIYHNSNYERWNWWRRIVVHLLGPAWWQEHTLRTVYVYAVASI